MSLGASLDRCDSHAQVRKVGYREASQPGEEVMAELACCLPTVSQVTGDEKTPLAYGLSQAGECWESFSPAWGGPGGMQG